MNARFFLLSSAVTGFLSVALGAFGAHALKGRLDDYHLGVFQTGVQYQFFHTFAIALVAILLTKSEMNWLKASGSAFLAGIFVFSGSLYLLALTGAKWWGAVTPIGGVAFMVGWILLFIAGLI